MSSTDDTVGNAGHELGDDGTAAHAANAANVAAHEHGHARVARRERGFVLVIVVVIAAAAAIIAAALYSSSEAARIGAGNALEGDVTDALAKSGIERASSYLGAIAKQSSDLDLALDPDQVATCRPSPACAGVHCNVPIFTDGGQVTYKGKNYTRVIVTGVGGAGAAAAGGAYLVRFDDDSDDQQKWPGPGADPWDAQSGNHGCDEGPPPPSGTGTNNEDMPWRDRNRSIIVTSIGIAPGMDPNTAQHRTVIRKLFTFLTPPTVASLSAGTTSTPGVGDINAGGGSTSLAACSPFGSVAALHDFQAGAAGRTCTCGDSRAHNAGSWVNCDAGGPGCGGAPSDCASGSNATPAPSQVPTAFTSANLSSAFDWGQCNFYVGTTGIGGLAPTALTLWYWDTAANRKPGALPCAGGPSTSPPPPPNAATEGACWTPVVIGTNASCIDPFTTGEVINAPIPCLWVPGTTPSTFTVLGGVPAPPPAGDGGSGVLLAPGVYNKPDWSSCQLSPAYPDTVFNGATTTHVAAADLGCTKCDNTHTHAAMRPFSNGGFWFTPALFDPNELKAVPAGAYFYPTNLSLGLTEAFAPGVPMGTLDMTNMPHTTIVVDGNITVNLLLGTVFFGVGQSQKTGLTPAFYPSIVATNDVTFNNGVARIAGSIWVGHDFKWNDNGTHVFDGELHAGHNITFQGNGTFQQKYYADFEGVGQATLATVPLTYVTSE